MATAHSSADRRGRRRTSTIDEALDHAVEIMTEHGVGGLTVSEMARRMGVRPPSLYKYFVSLHAVYDRLFARGLAELDRATGLVEAGTTPGPQRLRAGATATVRWAVTNPVLAQLLFWRPVPGFVPSEASFADSVDQMVEVRRDLAAGVRGGTFHADADSDAAVRLLTVLLSGLISQQLANQPGEPFETGVFSTLTDEVLDLFFAHYAA